MPALICTREGNPLEVLKLADQSLPPLKPGQVAIRMLAAAVNPSDLLTIRGTYGQPLSPARVPGYEGVGIVTQSGGGLFGRLLVGRRVAVLNSEFGTWRSETIAPAKSVIPVPQSLTNEQAAMFFVNPMTSYLLTRVILAIPKGAILVQSAGNSAVGKMVAKLGQHYGFETISVVRSSSLTHTENPPSNQFVTCAESASETAAKVLAAAGRPIAFAVDPLGGPIGTALWMSLGDGGRMVSYGSLTGEPLAIDTRPVLTLGLKLEGFWLSRYFRPLSLFTKIRHIRQVSNLVSSGVLSPEAPLAFPLENFAGALTAAEAPGKPQKVVLTLR